MRAATLERPAPTATTQAHAHHWIIEEAHGPESPAFCRVCGESRRFKNWLAESDFVTNEERRSAA